MAFWHPSYIRNPACLPACFFFPSPYVTVSFQNSVDAAKPLLRKAIQISQQTPYWHCRLLFQLAVSTVEPGQDTWVPNGAMTLGHTHLSINKGRLQDVQTLLWVLHQEDGDTGIIL